MTFFDIFSNTPIDHPKAISMVVDHREKNSLVIAELIKRSVELHFEQLAVADYLVQNIAVERKTIHDLKASIINKRIHSQLPQLKQYEKPLLLVEGIQGEDLYAGSLHENAFRGFLLSVALHHQIPIIFTQGAQDTAKYLILLAKKDSKHSSLTPRASKIAYTREQQMQYILEGFPSVGPATAKKLLKHFGSVKAVINASSQELEKILGKRTSEFLKVL